MHSLLSLHSLQLLHLPHSLHSVHSRRSRGALLGIGTQPQTQAHPQTQPQPRIQAQPQRTATSARSAATAAMPGSSSSKSEAVITDIFIHPLKGCRPLSVPHAAITPTGLIWDRQWMVVREDTGRFLTTRQEPRISLVVPSLPPEALTVNSSEDLPPDASLALAAPDMPPLHLPLPLSAYRRAAKKKDVGIWEWKGQALDAGDDAAAWFSTYLKRPCRVVRFNLGEALRPSDAEYAPGFEAGFSDGYMFLVASHASLKSLNSRLDSPLPIQRFRPNLLVDGCEAFEEDRWREFKIGDEAGREFRGVKPCDRCKVTTVCTETAEFKDEPLQTLRTFRTGKDLGLPKVLGANNVFFGMNCMCLFTPPRAPSAKASLISVGDKITVQSIADKPGNMLLVS